MIDVVLGIDVGTSGVRVAARRLDGRLCALSSAGMAAPLVAGQRIQQDAEIWWLAVQEAVLGLDRSGLNIRAIAVDGTSGTIVPINDQGVPLAFASLYNDVAQPHDVAKVQAVAPRDTAALGATSPLARALGFGSARIVHQADWIVGKLCDRFDVSDENNALKTGYDPVLQQWPHWIVSTGIDLKQLPKVVAAGTRVGTVTADAARLLNLPVDCAVVTGTTDGCAAFLASGASKSGDGVTSLGTTLTLKLLSATPVFAPEYGIYSHRIGNQWLAGGASNSGGGVLSHLFSADEIERNSKLLKPDEPTGLAYYPLKQAGERFPINDNLLQPNLSPRPVEDHLFFQAVLEGIADIESLGYQRLAELGASPLQSIRSVGGGAKNEQWTDIRLRRLKVPQLLSVSEHAAMGTARLAWRGLGFEQ